MKDLFCTKILVLLYRKGKFIFARKYFMRCCCMSVGNVQRKQHGRVILYNIVGEMRLWRDIYQ